MKRDHFPHLVIPDWKFQSIGLYPTFGNSKSKSQIEISNDRLVRHHVTGTRRMTGKYCDTNCSKLNVIETTRYRNCNDMESTRMGMRPDSTQIKFTSPLPKPLTIIEKMANNWVSVIRLFKNAAVTMPVVMMRSRESEWEIRRVEDQASGSEKSKGNSKKWSKVRSWRAEGSG